jgi:hypothetical protein
MRAIFGDEIANWNTEGTCDFEKRGHCWHHSTALDLVDCGCRHVAAGGQLL